MNGVYYNEIESFPCSVLRARIADGRLAGGVVDERDIKTVVPEVLAGFRRWHLFAGIGGCELGLSLAGWPDDWEILTGGFPCQDISTAGKGVGLEGERSGLFWELLRIVYEVRPIRLLLENVPPLRTRGYDRIADALESIGYTLWPLVVGAANVGAPHQRNRVWIVAHTFGERGAREIVRRSVGCEEKDAQAVNSNKDDNGPNAVRVESKRRGADRKLARKTGSVQEEVQERQRDWNADGHCRENECNTDGTRLREPEGIARNSCKELSPAFRTGWNGFPARIAERQHEWEQPRLVKFEVGCTVDGLSDRLVRIAGRHNKHALKAYGNAVVPQVVAAVARAWMDAERGAMSG